MSSQQPAKECRSIFSGHFYRMLSPEAADFMISAAAVQKLLLAASLAADASLADRMLWDLYVKHVDDERLRVEAEKEGIWDMGFSLEIRERLENELAAWLKTEDILNFFKNDFTELKEKVKIENFLATDGKFEFKKDYAQMVAEFFNVKLLKKNLQPEKVLIEKKFPIVLNEAGFDIFGSVEFKLNFQAPLRMLEDGSFEGVGEFRHNNIKNCSSLDFRCDVLELPLEGPLTMLIFVPNDFYTLLKQSIGRDYENFDKISERLEQKLVHVRLPKFKIETKIDLRQFFYEHGYRGMRDFFHEPIELNRMLENADGVKFELGKFWQHTSLEMSAPKAVAAADSTAKPVAVFDATKKSSLFVIKSEKVLYVMGHFFKKE